MRSRRIEIAGNPVIRHERTDGAIYYMTRDLMKETNYFIYKVTNKEVMLTGNAGRSKVDADMLFNRIVARG